VVFRRFIGVHARRKKSQESTKSVLLLFSYSFSHKFILNLKKDIEITNYLFLLEIVFCFGA
jgi:hypothetical protein